MERCGGPACIREPFFPWHFKRFPPNFQKLCRFYQRTELLFVYVFCGKCLTEATGCYIFEAMKHITQRRFPIPEKEKGGYHEKTIRCGHHRCGCRGQRHCTRTLTLQIEHCSAGKKSGCLQRDQWPQLCGGARRLCQPHWQPESEVLRRRQQDHGPAGRRAELPVQALRQGAGGQHPRGHGAAGAHHEAGRCQRLHRP